MVIITDSEQTIDETSSNASFTVDGTFSQESRTSSSHFSEEQQVQIFVKQILQNRLFVGHYQERRFVEFIRTYRDVIVIHKSEVDLIRDLESVRARLHNFYDSVWIGITGPLMVGAPAGFAVWVKLHDLPFGHYWFQVKQVKFREKEIYLRLKMVRPLTVTDPVTNKVIPAKKTESLQSMTSTSSSVSSAMSEDSIENALTDSMSKWRKLILEQFLANFTLYATFHNIKQTICFIAALFMATISGMVYGIQFAGDFSIRFLREMSLFLQASTPIVLGVIDFFSKLVGGMYLLLAMMWKGSARTNDAPQPRLYPAIRTPYAPPYVPSYTAPYPYRALPMPPLQRTSSKTK